MGPEVPDFHREMERKRSNRLRKLNRREWIQYSLLGGAGILTSIGYMAFEAQWVEINEREILLSAMDPRSNFKLLHLSDLHLSRIVSIEYLQMVIKEGMNLSPHACVITGDFITDQPEEKQLNKLHDLLKAFASKVPTYACMGNHDGGKWAHENGGYATNLKIRKLLESSNVIVLENERMEVYWNGVPVDLAGLGDLWSGNCRPNECLDKKLPGKKDYANPILLMNHNPDARDALYQYNWDLMLSGHTHGGQFRIPFQNYAPFAPVNDRSRTEGAFGWKDRVIHITRGVGNVYGLRLNCRPEISLLSVTGIDRNIAL